MHKKEDLRVVKTNRAIFKAFHDLLQVKNYDKITVTEICQKAQVRKATFYQHFGDKLDLFLFIIQRFQEKYTEEYENSTKSRDFKEFYAGIFNFIVDKLEKNDQTFKSLFQSSSKYLLFDMCSQQIQHDIQVRLERDMEAMGYGRYNPELISHAYTGSLMDVVLWWAMNRNRISKEEVKKQVTKIIHKL